MVVRKWEHAGMTCCIRHGLLGAPCGYVRVPEGHPFYRKHYDRCDVDAYCGLTFSGYIGGEDGWWLGFDMGHSCDIEFTSEPFRFRLLRTDDDCAIETNKLAERLAERGE